MNTPLPNERALDSSLIPTMRTVAAFAWRYRSPCVRASVISGLETNSRRDTNSASGDRRALVPKLNVLGRRRREAAARAVLITSAINFGQYQNTKNLSIVFRRLRM